ncbi:MAG TPA: low temperature requirement protein A [Candidatus Dormibacteraeota bacterium]|nr:low temperature requirement protein A [Candidatus Dormibacteraeota bacterium]
MKPAIPSPYSADSAEPRVTSLELFFDLVFVFTITQLTSLLARDPNLTGLLQMLLIFGNVWWMYGGYAWLTNAVPPRELGVRLLLLLGMSGFLLIALAIPTTFAAGGIAFGVGYMIVTLVHTGVFMRTSQQSAIQALIVLGPSNLFTAVLLLAAGFTNGGLRWTLFAAAFVLHWVTPYFGRTGMFRIRVGHFVERHGLILLIAIGESVVAVGIGLGNAALPIGRIITALLGLALAASLWWLYFNGDEERAHQAMERAPEERRPWLAVQGFGYIFLPLLGGIVVVAAGMKLAVVGYDEAATVPTALFLASGVTAYAIGLVLFRWLLQSGPLSVRLAIAVLALPTALIGTAITPLAQVGALVAILVIGAIADSVMTNRRSVR